MSDVTVLSAEARDRVGKGAARAARRAGRLPAVIYGDGKDPVTITLDPKELWRELRTPGFFTNQYTIDIAGTKHSVLPRDIQFHPVRDEPMHVDFLRVSARTRVNVMVPMVFTNEEQSPGLARGGVLNVVRHEVEINSRVGDIPDGLEIDLTGTEIGDSIHISDVKLPDGVTPTISDRDFTIATIAAPTIETEPEEAEEEEELEGEVEGEAAEGEEGAEGEEETKEESGE